MPSTSRPTTSPASPSSSPGPVRLAPLLPVAAALFAYWGSLRGDYVFDDLSVFVEGSAMAHGDWWGVAFGSAHTPLANRPLTCLTFALQPRFGAPLPMAFHAGNLLCHVANTLLLFGVVRRCLELPRFAGRFAAPRATWIAAAIAALWACHPLGTDAVAYITQRSTLLMSCGLLGALYCVLRHEARPDQRRWRRLAVLSLALGIASKEDLVAAPLLVVLFERAFLLPDWTAVRARLPFYLQLTAAWLVLALCLALGPSNPTVGYASLVHVSPFEWLMTQAGVILHYLRLVVWPHPLRGAYDWGIVRDLGTAALPMFAVTALLGAALWQWRRRPWLAWLGTMFFLLLGPTSSLMPIVTEVVAERRMYLPMLAVLVPVVLGAAWLAERLLAALKANAHLRAAAYGVLTAGVVVPAVMATRAHAATYRNQQTFWTSAYEQNELTNGSLVSAVVLGAYGQLLHDRGQVPEAVAMLERAMRCEAKMERVPLTYGEFLRETGRLDESERVLRELLQKSPDVGPARGILAFVLVTRHEAALAKGQADPSDPRLAEAVRLAQRAYELDASPAFLNTLGMALSRQGHLAEAEEVLRRALRADASLSDARRTLGGVLCSAGRVADGVAMWEQVLVTAPNDIALRLAVVQAYQHLGDTAAAVAELREVLRRQPDHALAQGMLQELTASGR